MDLRKLKTLIDLVSDSQVQELEITEAEGKVRIVKGPTGMVYSAAPAMGMMQQQPMQPMMQPAPIQAAPAAPALSEAAADVVALAGHTVKSPMVGSFYRSSSPEA